MLLLQRKSNESVVIHKNDDQTDPMVIRVVEVLPTGDVTLGFLGRSYQVVRSEIFQSNEEKHMVKGSSTNERNNYTYYS